MQGGVYVMTHAGDSYYRSAGDGAAAVLICNEKGLQRLGLRPRAKVKHSTGVGMRIMMIT